MAFPGVPDIDDRRPRSRASSTPRSSWSAATWRGPASPGSSGSSSSTSTTIPGNTGYGQINWFDARRRRVRRDGVRPGARARRAAVARDRDAHLPGHPDRHRLVPLLEHLAADVRHLPRGARSRRRSGAGRAQRLRQQQHGPAEAVRRRAERDADRPDRPHRHRLSRSRDGARGRRHLRGHRRADQPAADGQGNPGGACSSSRTKATSTASACARRATSTSAPSPRSSAAAATRTPPAAP